MECIKLNVGKGPAWAIPVADAKLGLGACLADDMGLGKTIQVLSLLLVLRRSQQKTSLLVAPASLLANWASEIERFAPGLQALIAHPSALPAADLKTLTPERVQELFHAPWPLPTAPAHAG